jgi:hypothetical protein
LKTWERGKNNDKGDGGLYEFDNHFNKYWFYNQFLKIAECTLIVKLIIKIWIKTSLWKGRFQRVCEKGCEDFERILDK